jgi:hypothetical protein
LEYNAIDNSGGGIRSVGSYVVLRGNIITNANKLPSEICAFHSDGIMSFGGSEYCWIMDNYMFNTIEGIYLSYTNGGTSHFTIINNVLIGNYDAAGGTGDYAIYANSAPFTRIYNNTIFGLPGMRGWLKGIGIGAMDGSAAPSPNCEVKNNLIYVPNGEHTWIGIVDASSTTGFISDYNIIYIPNETNGKPFKINDVDKTWAEWQAAGYDVHGSISEPALVKTSGSIYTDFDLRLSASDTVARDKGTTGLWAFDINQISRPQGTAWDIGAYEYVQSAVQNLSLVLGWNWISFNMLPADLSLNSIFADILSPLSQVKTQTQSAIHSNGAWKGDLVNMSGIGQYKMYKVKVNTACTLTVSGTAVLSATPINLAGGWNWVAYLPTTVMPIATALDSIKGHVQEVKNLTQSATYNGTTWSGTLTQLEPGHGYAIKMSRPGTLIYPAAAATQANQHNKTQ